MFESRTMEHRASYVSPNIDLRRIVLAIILLVFAPHPAASQVAQNSTDQQAHASHELTLPQESSPILYSAGALFQINKGSAAIQAFEGSSECGVFTNATSRTPSFFVRGEIPVYSDLLTFTPSLSFRDLSSTFETTPTNVVHGHRPGDVGLVEIVRSRSYSTRLSTLSLSTLAGIAILPALKFKTGPSIGIFLQHSYSEQERIVSPSDAIYSERYGSGTSREIRSGSINVNAISANFDGQLGYDIPLRNGIVIRPTISASLPLTRISNSASENWRMTSFGAGIELGYDRTSEAPPMIVETPVSPDPPVPAATAPKSILQLSIRAVGLADDGKEIEEPVLSVERMKVTEVYPLLGYVFFEDGSSELPDRYLSNTSLVSDFDERSLYASTALEIHHNVLDIVGKRMSEHPNANVVLTGTYSEHSKKDSLAGPAVALERAMNVAAYLGRTWNISLSRVHVKARALPEAASDERSAFGQEENRRVEITSSDSVINAPLRAHRIERLATPPKISFYPTIVSSAGAKTGRIIVKQRGRVLQSLDALSGGAAGEYLWSLDENSMPNERDTLTYTFVVEDSLGNVQETEGMIRLRQQVRESSQHSSDTLDGRSIERFSLLLFDYNSSQVAKRQMDNIMSEIAQSLDQKCQVTLTGHTDQTGDDAYNERLAAERVGRAAQLLTLNLRRFKKVTPTLNIESHGSRDILFDNALPEGRLLSRTVRVTVEHDIAP
jgi:outer membrane protein OmpA-like peptidoglycan-associated protein